MKDERLCGGAGKGAMDVTKSCATLLWIAAAALGAAALGLLICYIISRMAFYSRPKKRVKAYTIPKTEQYNRLRERSHRLIGEMEALPCERVEILSKDGLRLRARYYQVRQGAPVVLCAHGYRANAIRDFCGGAWLCMDAGFNVLLIDQRAQGESEGRYMTFGLREREDVDQWARYLVSRFGRDTQIVLYGISMGGATVLMAMGLDLPKNVRGVIADCPYSSAKEIIQKVSADLHLPPKLAYPFVKWAARLFAKFDPEQTTAKEAAAKSALPAIILHGEDDRFVPCAMGREIAEANASHVRFYSFPQAGHGVSYLQDEARYRAVVSAFLREVTHNS